MCKKENEMRFDKLLLALTTLGLTLCGLFSVSAQEVENRSIKAQELLKQARSAIGGDSALIALQSLSASGEYRGEMQERDDSGEIKLDFLLPDRFMKTVKIRPKEMPGITRIETVNGDQVWVRMERQQDRSMMEGGPLGGSPVGGPTMGGGRTGGGRRSSAGGAPGGGRGAIPEMAGPMNSPDVQHAIRTDYISLLSGLLLSSPLLSSAEFNPTGNLNDNKSDELKFLGGEGLTLSLFLDQKTHRPAMISYIGSLPHRPVFIARRTREPAEDSQAADTKSPTGRVEVYFFDFRAVTEKSAGEMWLPFGITKSVDGRTTEEIHIKKYTLNPGLKPKQFEEKKN
jgi:hypothetical protein